MMRNKMHTVITDGCELKWMDLVPNQGGFYHTQSLQLFHRKRLIEFNLSAGYRLLIPHIVLKLQSMPCSK